MLRLVYFDYHSVVHLEYAPEGQTVSDQYCREVPRCLPDAVRFKRLNLWELGNWQLAGRKVAQVNRAPKEARNEMSSNVGKSS